MQSSALKAHIGKSIKKAGPYKPTSRIVTAVNGIPVKGVEKYLVVCVFVRAHARR